MRAVVDPNVLISAMLSPSGAPARVLRAWMDGAFELLIAPLLVAELQRALAYPRLRKRIPAEDAEQLVEWLRRSATMADDPTDPPPVSSADPGDDYLLALAANQHAALVSGDKHVLAVGGGELPIYTPGSFLEAIKTR